jgi:hypothetical protein
MKGIDDLAADLQRMGRSTEEDQLRLGVDYSEQHVRLATVHARQDLVLVVSYLSAIAKDVRRIQQWIATLGLLALITLFVLVILPGWRH